MSINFSWDDYRPSRSTIPPFWTVDHSSGEKVLNWGTTAFRFLIDHYRQRHEKQFQNYALYRGEYNQKVPEVGGHGRESEGVNQPRVPRVAINHTKDLVEQKVTNILRFPPTADYVPASNEYKDKINANACKKIMESILYQCDLESILTKQQRRAILGSRAYAEVFWNPEKGELTKEAKKLREKKDILSRDGIAIETENETKVHIKDLPRLGDVDFKLWLEHEVLLIPSMSGRMKEVPGLCTWELQHVDTIRAQYPEHAGNIEPTKDLNLLDMFIDNDQLYEDQVLIIRWFFRRCKELPHGAHFVTTHDTILVYPEELPVQAEYLDSDDLGNMPFAHLDDVDTEKEMYPGASVNDIAVLQSVYDKLTSLIHRNIFLFSHPKWLIPSGAVTRTSLTNRSTVVEFQGPTPPQLQVYPSISNEIFQFWAAVEEKMEKVFGIFSVSRGAPPPGTRAASSLQFWEEQESQRQGTSLKKMARHVERIHRLALAVVADEYDKGDSRLVRILGADKSWEVEEVSLEALKRPYDIRVEYNSSLPVGKTARLNALLETIKVTAEADPQGRPYVEREQFHEMMAFGQTDKYLSSSYTALLAAQSENEDFQRSKDVEAPIELEDHIIHWKEHVKLAQKRSFKKQSQETQEAIKDHIGAHEALMFMTAENNPAYKQALFSLMGFPSVLPQPLILPEQQQQQQKQQGENNGN